MSMDDKSFTRRDTFTLAGAAVAAQAPVFAAGATARPGHGRRRPNVHEQATTLERALADPAQRARIMARVRGSAAEQTVYTFCRLHMYLWLNDGNLRPIFTMLNLNAASWKPLPNGNFHASGREVGVYTKFDTDEVIDVWENPVTGEKREVWEFIGGPISVEIGPEGLVTGAGATLKPKEMRPDVLGEMLILTNQSAFSFPNSLNPETWPKEAGGPTFYWDSHYYYAARVSEVLDGGLPSVPAAVQYQNLVSFHPWLGMGRTPGRTYGKGLGAKLTSLDDLPPPVRSALEKRTPEIFDLDAWTKPRNDFAEFVQKRKPT
jgi:hypothetical protein